MRNQIARLTSLSVLMHTAAGLCLVILVGPAHHQCAADVELVGRWAEGPCYAIDVVGSVVYGGDGAWLEIVSFPAFGQPLRLGRCLLPGAVRGVSVDGTLVAVANGHRGLRLLDASVPANVHEVGFLESGVHVGAVALAGAHAYLATGDDGLRVVDVSDPTSPFEVGSLGTPGHADRIFVDDGTAYVSDGRSLRIVDVSAPSVPVEVSHFDLTDSESETLMGFDVVGIHAYLVTRSEHASDPEGLRIIDLGDPTAPIEASYLDISDYGRDVDVNGTLAYVTGGMLSLRIFDVADPTTPFEIGHIDGFEPYFSVEVRGTDVYLAAGRHGMRAANVADPTRPRLAANWVTHGATTLAVARDNHAYVNLAGEGLHIFDIVSPVAPSLIAPQVPGVAARGMAIRDQHAYVVTDDFPDLRVLELSDPAAPIQIAAVDIGGQDTPHDIALAGDLAFTPLSGSHSPGRLGVVDLSDPAAPVLAGWGPGSNPTCVAAEGNIAYFGDGQGLWILDATDPQNPVVASTLPELGHVSDLVCDRDLLYLTCPATGLHVVDATNPYAPVEVASLPLPGEANAIALHINVAYIAAGSAGLQVVSLVDPTSPFVIDHHPTGDDASAITIDNERVFVADGDAGFWIFMADILTPAPESTTGANRLGDVHPNPFNPQVTITFELAHAQYVQVAVYDLAGRRLTELASGVRDRGHHAVVWNGRDVAARPAPSGMYLVRIEGEGWSGVRKVTLAR